MYFNELAQVKQVIKQAGKTTLSFYNRDDYNIEQKDPYSEDSPLTQADLVSEQVILKGLKSFNYGILSEETDQENDRLNKKMTWIIDPLDGTKDFIQKTGDYSIMIGLAENGIIVMGVVYQPTTDTLYYAIKGQGAFKEDSNGNRQRLNVSSISNLSQAKMMASRNHLGEFEQKFAQENNIKEFVKSGSAGLKICKVASGIGELYICSTDKTGEWDIAAAEIILRESGGTLTDMKGNYITFNKENSLNVDGFIATNKLLHHKTLSFTSKIETKKTTLLAPTKHFQQNKKKISKIDYLIFTSNKTGSCSIEETLKKNNFKTERAHILKELGLNDGDLGNFIDTYFSKFNRKIEIISVYRDPIERLFSKFFNFHGTSNRKLKNIKEEDTLIGRKTVSELINIFKSSFIPRDMKRTESIDVLMKELGINFNNLKFDPQKTYCTYSSDKFNLHLFRFDLLVEDMQKNLSELTGQNLSLYLTNVSQRKWYHNKYQAFKRQISLPQEIINSIYSKRMNLLKLFYPNSDQIIQEAINKYAATDNKLNKKTKQISTNVVGTKIKETQNTIQEIKDLDFLVITSPKTASRTIYKTLVDNKFKSLHAHRLEHLNLSDEQLKDYLEKFKNKHNKKLKIISVFRDPLDRLVSAYFQMHGSGLKRINNLKNKDTLIAQKNTTELISDFQKKYLFNKNRPAHQEAITCITKELGLTLQDLNFNPDENINFIETNYCKFYYYRFDLLVKNFEIYLSDTTNTTISMTNTNTSSNKWYFNHYQKFKSELQLPNETIELLYKRRKALMNLFYDTQYEEILNNKIEQYGK